ncbi:Asp23/Gls24 family envelope stress response protein [Acetomicrobium hydrogeniformans]|jgi:uncharacterized alkaline shock family protein YloU|uniref:Asp23/Gls24 family envelope stress response protein n=1 Tax=Acetomicrobium hydrogeniformans ATCC BAA-1850 TaxID=592015 RepID=A0A0T5XDX6_9BACT|nr:Asp23/Gls24 family envelope stress response protein [Acetomicrobium hydrogeniformans]KRT36126.1 hypothetical protein HMPREF1705_03388 [Acetomicrobium hydrogeniformans ATCC BAA-1850]
MDEEREKNLSDLQESTDKDSYDGKIQNVNEYGTEEETAQEEPVLEEAQPQGEVVIAEEVISQMAIEALKSVPGVLPASSGLVANLRLGRRPTSGVKITIEEGTPNEVVVDTYISVKYGLRIPDIAWDVQEAIKNQIENYTGYIVKAVNVHVQGIHFAENKLQDQYADNIQ